MDMSEISGERALALIRRFDYIREAGSPDERLAAEELLAWARELGLEAEIEEFSFQTRHVDRATLRACSPEPREYVVRAYSNSGRTGSGGITAPFLYVEDGDDISLSHAEGRIVLINNRVDVAEYNRLARAGVRGFISIVGTPLDQGGDRIPDMKFSLGVRDASIPGLCIHYLDARELVERGTGEVNIGVAWRYVVRKSQNVVIRIPGTERPDEIIALSAHYDSVPMGPGAYDDMSGVAIVLEACRYFANHPPRRTMEFLLFGAEEKGLQGSQAFVRARGPMDRYLLDLNVDLAGQLVGGTVLGITADPTLCQTIERLLWQSGIGARVKRKIWSSDSNTFAASGVPALTLNRDGFGMHTRHDTVELISAWALEREGRLLTYLAANVDQMNPLPFRREIPEEMQTALRRYFEE